jgi:carboxyl-terminal processing protease
VSKLRRSHSGLAALLILACSLLGGLYGASNRRPPASDNDLAESLRVFTRVLSAIEENYADPVNVDKAIYNGAIPGMLRTLDPHSNFFDPKLYKLMREDTAGRYYGVGMTVQQRAGRITVIEPFLGSPAFRAGIRPGDIVDQVEGESTINMTTSDVADRLKGRRGTPVHVVFLREGAEKPIELVLTRDEIPRPSVDQAFEVHPGFGYLKLSTFNETTSRELGEALRKLDAARLQAVILDLRGNLGGLLNEGISVADMFLEQGQVVVSHRGRSSPERVYRVSGGNRGHAYPLIVLIDRSSASASEIVAGAIQDHDRGLVIGETSFGKGLVQNVYPLSENTGLALTIARYYTPSGRLIQRDFARMSLYDYYYTGQERERNNETHAGQEVRTTDGGRLVYGGGGITPDIKFAPPRLSRLRQTLESRLAFFNFAKAYLAVHHTVPRDFRVTEETMAEFRAFLQRQNIAVTDEDLRGEQEMVARRIQRELLAFLYGRAEGDRIQIKADPLVLKAMELTPQAKELVEQTRRVLAQKRAR